MPYGFEEAANNYNLYILICLIAIFILGVIALIILSSKAKKQLKAAEKIMELLGGNADNGTKEQVISSEPEMIIPEEPREELEDQLIVSESEIKSPAETVKEPQDQMIFSEPEIKTPEEVQEVRQDQMIFSEPEIKTPEEVQEVRQDQMIFSEPEIIAVKDPQAETQQQAAPVISKARIDLRIDAVFADRTSVEAAKQIKEEEQNVIITDISGLAPAPDIKNDNKRNKKDKPMFYKEMSERVHMRTNESSPSGAVSGRMTYDTAKSGRTYNKEEIESIIKD